IRGWKDPRTCVLLPFWRTVATIDDVVVVVRHPDAVSQSLAMRNELAADVAAEAWIRSLVQVRRSAPHARALFHEDAVADPVATASRLAGWLDLPPPDEKVRARIADWVDPDLVNAEAAASGDSPALRTARSLHAALRTGHASLGGVLERIHAGGLAERTVGELTHALRQARSRARQLESALADSEEARTAAEEARATAEEARTAAE